MFSNTCPETVTGHVRDCFASAIFGRLRKSSEVFGHPRESSDVFMSSSKSRHSQDKNLMPITQKKLAGIVLDQMFVGIQILSNKIKQGVQIGKSLFTKQCLIMRKAMKTIGL